MTRSTLRPQIFRALQSGNSYTRQFNPVKKFKKFFSVSLATLFFIPPVFAQEAFLLPPQSGTLIDSYRVPEVQGFQKTSEPVIVHIQDAHNSLAVQKNIAALIEHLVRHYGFQAVYEEGNTGRVRTSGVFWMPEKIRRPLAEQFLKEGKITGAEFAHISGPRGFKLYGAEESVLYERNLDLRQEVLFYKPVMAGYLNKLEKEMSRAAARLFSGDLRRYLKQSENFWKGAGKAPFEVAARADESAAQIWAKLQARDRAERERLASGAPQKEMLEKLELLSVLKRVASLEATREDLESYFKQQDEAGALLGDSSLVKESFRQVVQFYDLARQRDMALIRRTLDGMAKRRQNRVILISGGFHSRGLAEILKKQGVSYAVIAPISSPAAHTLRMPNLFNLPRAEARLLADLRAMQIAKGKDRAAYYALKRDAARLWKRFQAEQRKIQQPALPAVVAPEKAIILLPLDRVDSSDVLTRLFPWVASLTVANHVDFVFLTQRQEDTRLIRQYLNRHVEEQSVRQRVQAVRLLTAGDFGAVANQTHGKYVLLVGRPAQKRRLELAGLKPDQFLPLNLTPFPGSHGQLYQEIQRLQLSRRAFMAAA